MRGGRWGDVADEFALMRAAERLGTTPWDLEQREVKWTDWALEMISAEQAVAAEVQKRANARR